MMTDGHVQDPAGGGLSAAESAGVAPDWSSAKQSEGGSAVERGLSAGKEGFHAKLQALFGEVNALANRLRNGGAAGEGNDPSLGGGRKILEVLAQRGPRTVPGIARAHGSSRQNIQVLVNRLGSQGCVELTLNPAHKRSALVHLTERGKMLLERVTERERKSLEGLSHHIPEVELLPATEVLRQVRHLLGGDERPSGTDVRGPVIGKRARGRPRATRGGGRSSTAAEGQTATGGGRKDGSVPAAPKEPEPLPGVPEESPPDEEEFPVNLL